MNHLVEKRLSKLLSIELLKQSVFMHGGRAKVLRILNTRHFFPPHHPLLCHHSMNASNICKYFTIITTSLTFSEI